MNHFAIWGSEVRVVVNNPDGLTIQLLFRHMEITISEDNIDLWSVVMCPLHQIM